MSRDEPTRLALMLDNARLQTELAEAYDYISGRFPTDNPHAFVVSVLKRAIPKIWESKNTDAPSPERWTGPT